jgi:hypothetical protein
MATNTLTDVVTYNKANLAFLENSFAFINLANKRYKNFENITYNRGLTVSWDLAPRYIASDGLVVNFATADSEQRVKNLTVDKKAHVPSAFTTEEEIFNVADYMDRFGKAAIMELGTKVEQDIATTILPNTYRHYGDGITAINSYNQLADMVARFRNYGAAKDKTCGILDDIEASQIVGSGLTQFVPGRNERTANSWELGGFKQTQWYESNLLPTHTAGTVGNSNLTATPITLVVTGVTTGLDGGITAITCSGAGGDVGAIKENDLLTFQDGTTAGTIDVRYRTFIGHGASRNKVQIRAAADADSVADSVTIQIDPYLYSAAGRNQNITTPIVAGMELKALPNHRAGVLYSGNALYVAMPKLPSKSPYTTALVTDKASGCSLRMYSGSSFDQDFRGTVHDVVWGKTLVAENAMRIIFPLD